MRDKKKIFALVLFILMGFFMFTFANPSDGIDELTTPVDETEKDTTKPVVEEKPIQVNNTVNQVIAVIDNAPVITVNPKEVKIIRGTDYDVTIGVTIADDKDTNLKPTISMTSTVEAKVGTYTITYTVTDSGNNTATATRTVKVLEPASDEDKDGYTNKEEYDNDTDFDDENEYPEYDKSPSITIDENNTFSMEINTKVPTFTATATDAADGDVDVVITHNIDPTKLGTYVVTFTAIDVLGNKTTLVKDFTVVDTKAPVIDNFINSSNGNWTNGEVVTTWDIVEDGSGIKTVEYCYTAECNDWKTMSSSEWYGLTRSAERNDTVYVRAIDNADNISNVIAVIFKIDKTAPKFANTNTSHSATNIKIEVSDEASVIKTIKVYNQDTNKTFTINNGDELTEEATYHVYATDNAGNSSNIWLAIDKTAPTINVEDGKYYNDDVTLVVSDKFLHKGSITINGVEHKSEVVVGAKNENGTYTTTLTDEGTYVIVASDKVGNKTTKAITIDKTSPVISNLHNSSNGNWTNSEVVTTWDITESSSGIKTVQYCYSADCTDWKTMSSSEWYGLTRSAERNDTVYVRAIDNANNISNVIAVIFKIDKTKPTITTDNIASMTVYGNIPHFAGTADDGSTVIVDYSKINPDVAGQYEITYTATDEAGNSTTITKVVTVEKISLAVSIDNKTSQFGSALEDLTYTVKSGEELASNPADITLSSTVTAESVVGTYPITGVYTNTNYDITFTDGVYTVAEKTLTNNDLSGITFAGSSLVYDGTAHSLAINGTLPSGVTVAYTNNSITNVGSITVTATFTGSGNYAGSITKTATLVVTPKEVAAVWGTTTFTYNGSPQVPTATFTDVNDVIQNLVVLGEQTNAGIYTATTSLIDTNYTLTNTLVNFTINKAVPSVPSIGTLTADERQHLNDIVLPSGFTFEDQTNPVLVIGNLNTNLIYTPSDTINYATVILPVTITVNEKYFDVVFYDYDGITELKSEEVERGHDATAPSNPTRANYTFSGWSTIYTNVTSDLNVYATYTANQTGIRVAVNPNVQFQFQKGSQPVITNLIRVYEVYADGSEVETIDYTAPINTTSVTTSPRTLTITQGTFTDTSIQYSVVNGTAYQTKFNVVFGDNNYRATKDSCWDKNCDSNSKTNSISTNSTNFLEITDNYDDLIQLKTLTVEYTNGTSAILSISSFPVRWSKIRDYVYYNPTYIGYLGTFYGVNPNKDMIDIADSVNVINKVYLVYSKSGQDHTITFAYNQVTNIFTAISES